MENQTSMLLSYLQAKHSNKNDANRIQLQKKTSNFYWCPSSKKKEIEFTQLRARN